MILFVGGGARPRGSNPPCAGSRRHGLLPGLLVIACYLSCALALLSYFFCTCLFVLCALRTQVGCEGHFPLGNFLIWVVLIGAVEGFFIFFILVFSRASMGRWKTQSCRSSPARRGSTWLPQPRCFCS